VEVILNSNKIKFYLKNITNKISSQIQLKLNKKQKNVECNANKHALNLDKLNSVDCSLGCQLHVISAGIICATEMDRQYLVLKHQGKYDEYFSSFELVCGHQNQKLGNFLHLHNLN
jgi:hypothetical protein